ncbi:MAG: hypothetical protein AB7O28_18600 [Vicinamibacterales bacterium]
MRVQSRSSLRRLCVVLAMCFVTQLAAPAPALAWFGWLDKWSGPGQWWGGRLDVRLICFGQTTQYERLREAARRYLASAEALEPQLSVFRSLRVDASSLELGFVAAAAMRDSARQLSVAITDMRRESQLAPAAGVENIDPGPFDRLTQALARAIAANRSNDGQVDITSALRAEVESSAAALSTGKKQVAHWNQTIAELFALAAGPGVIVSLCPPGIERRLSVDIDVSALRTLWNTRDFADGQPMYFVSTGIGLNRRIGSFRRNWLDLGAAVGTYSVFSKGLPQNSHLTGLLLQPLYLDWHLPPTHRWATDCNAFKRTLARLTVRTGVLMFPLGISKEALNGVRGVGAREKIANVGIYYNRTGDGPEWKTDGQNDPVGQSELMPCKS